ncbi:MAG TPA: diguanylate cyclase [Acidimicrobiales bacterium]|jgi:diguanylate cyclase (GGDEF)-like protein/PAS domain S-box-containing protein|nr:diguanylate cyclase [Acidimicrobiales bacterium]
MVRIKTRNFPWKASARPELPIDQLYLDRRLRETFERAPIGEAVVGIGGYFLEVNPAFCRMLGYSGAELYTLRFAEMLGTDDADGHLCLQEALAGKATDDPIELRCYRKNGTHIDAECFVSPISDGDGGHPAYVIVQMQDVSQNRDRDRLSAVVDNSPDVLSVVAPDGTLLYASRAYRSMFGVDPSSAIGHPVGGRTHPDDVDRVRSTLEGVAGRPDGISTFSFRVAGADGEWRHIEVTAANWTSDPAIGGIVCNGRDVTTRSARAAGADGADTHDPLTGLPGRRMVTERSEKAVGAAKRNGPACAFLLVDIDHFSVINERYGRDVGDLVLTTLSRRLPTWLRPDDMLARYGADVFAVVAEGLPSNEVGTELMRRMLQATSSPVSTPAGLLPVRTSIGGAVWDGEDSASLIANAGVALTEAKRGGRNRGIMWTPPI